MLKLKQGKCDLDFVEIMACPNGCVNGGGQLKEEQNQGQAVIPGERIRELSSVTAARVSAVEKTFRGTQYRRPEDAPLVKYLYSSVNHSQLKTFTSSHATNSQEEYSITEDMKVPTSRTLDPLIPECGMLGRPLGPRSMALLHTRYHSVPKLELIAPLAAKW